MIANPIAINAMPEEILITRIGKCSPINFPASTPKPAAKTNAKADPIKTDHRFALFAESIKVASWVLSPNSARKMVKKVIKKSFTLMDLVFYVY